MEKPQLIVMAAGIGSRYGGLKQVDPVGPCGEIVIDYSIYDALKAGFGKVVFVIREEIDEVFREKVGSTIEKYADTEYVYQELDKLPDGFSLPPEREKPWGTGHAVLCAGDAVDAPFGVINADDFYGSESFEKLCGYLRSAEDGKVYDYSMVGFILWKTLSDYGYVSRGVCTADENGKLKDIVERTKIKKFGEKAKYSEDGGETWQELDSNCTVSMNMWGFTQSFFDELGERFPDFLEDNIEKPKAEFFVPTVVNELIQEGKAEVAILPTKAQWFGVTYQEDKKRVKESIRELIENGEYPEDLWGEFE